jgi:transposase
MACPGCGTRPDRVPEHVPARPRDARRGLDQVELSWLKRRFKCGDGECERKTFTESLSQVPPRCRVTGRLRELAAAEIADRGITAAAGNHPYQVTTPPRGSTRI